MQSNIIINIIINIKQAPLLDDRRQETINYCCSITFLRHDGYKRIRRMRGRDIYDGGRMKQHLLLLLLLLLLLFLLWFIIDEGNNNNNKCRRQQQQ